MRGRALALYVVVFRPGFIGLLSTCIAIAFLTILASAITILIHHGDDVEFGDSDRRPRPSVSHADGRCPPWAFLHENGPRPGFGRAGPIFLFGGASAYRSRSAAEHQ